MRAVFALVLSKVALKVRSHSVTRMVRVATLGRAVEQVCVSSNSAEAKTTPASTTEIFISRQRSFNASVYLSFETCSGKTDISDSMLVPCDASSDSGQPPHFGHDKNTDTGTGSTRAVWRRRRLSGEILTRAASRAVCEAATSKFPPPRAGAPAKSRFCSATISRRAALRRAKRPAGETS